MVVRISTQLARMDAAELVDLRKQVDAALAGLRTNLERQLAALGGTVGRGARVGGGSVLKGKKVAAKYRGPGGETWAGRGATPRWLVAATKGTGKKRDDFLIDKAKKRK